MRSSARPPSLLNRLRLAASLCLAAGSLLAAGIAVARAGEAPAIPSAESAGPPRLLVLSDGRIVHGRISERPGGYLVDMSVGSTVIPYEMIRLAAASLDDAYIKQRDSLVKPTASDHLALAQWCFANKLYEQANEQLASCLRLEPQRSEARELLRSVASASAPSEIPAGTPGPSRATRTSNSRDSRLPTTVVGPELRAEFIRRVQPLLVNKCGNANCHGGRDQPATAFHLANIRSSRGQQRTESDENLLRVLGQLDLDNPNASPLLRRPTEDSAAHAGVFSGRLGTEQLQSLRGWTRRVVAELRGEIPGDGASPGDIRFPTIITAAADLDGSQSPFPQLSDNAAATTAVFPAAATSEAGPRPRALPRGQSPLLIEVPRQPQHPPVESTASAPVTDDSAFLKRILEDDAPDLFDPREFNRKVHGAAAGTAR